MPDDTILAISGIGLTPYSARGLIQTLEHIGAASSQRRTVNGELLDLSAIELQKYRSRVSCEDMNVPPLDGVWPGQTLVVDCVQELAYLTSGGSPSRSVVPGSSRVEGDYTFYRPRLTMMVVAFSTQLDEWDAAVGWSLDLEEI